MKGYGNFILVAILFLCLNNKHNNTVQHETITINWPQLSVNGKWDNIPLSPIESQFSLEMPGGLAKFSDGESVYILRYMTQVTRKLHPIADCFKSSGYQIKYEPNVIFKDNRYYSYFTASRNEETLRVMESIWDANGNSWSDVSTWYWCNFFEENGPWFSCAIVANSK